MTRAPLMRPLVSGGDAGSFLTALGVAGGGADPPDLDVGLDADLEDEDNGAIRRGVHELPCHRGVHELPCRRGKVGTTDGIPSTGKLPPSMCASTFSRVRPGPLHQW
jgi:hypothetical protein